MSLVVNYEIARNAMLGKSPAIAWGLVKHFQKMSSNNCRSITEKVFQELFPDEDLNTYSKSASDSGELQRTLERMGLTMEDFNLVKNIAKESKKNGISLSDIIKRMSVDKNKAASPKEFQPEDDAVEPTDDMFEDYDEAQADFLREIAVRHCQAQTKTGSKCRRSPVKGTQYCSLHQLEVEDENKIDGAEGL